MEPLTDSMSQAIVNTVTRQKMMEDHIQPDTIIPLLNHLSSKVK